MVEQPDFDRMAKLSMGEDAVTHAALDKLLLDSHATASEYSAKATIDASGDNVQIRGSVNGMRQEPITGRASSGDGFDSRTLIADLNMGMSYFGTHGEELGTAQFDLRASVTDPLHGQIRTNYTDTSGRSVLQGAGTLELRPGQTENHSFAISTMNDASGNATTVVDIISTSQDAKNASTNTYVLKEGVHPNNADEVLNLRADDVVGVVHSTTHESGDRAIIDVQIQARSKPAIPQLEQTL